MKRQNGMTLIELVIVIIVLGIIATVAAPKLIDVSGSAVAASVDGAKGAFKSAVSMAQASDRRSTPDHGTITSALDANFDTATDGANGNILVDADGDATADLTITVYSDAACTGGNEIDITGAAANVLSWNDGATCTAL